MYTNRPRLSVNMPVFQQQKKPTRSSERLWQLAVKGLSVAFDLATTVAMIRSPAVRGDVGKAGGH